MSDTNFMSNDNATTIFTAYANAIKENENVQSDWNESDNSKDDYIKNKPTLGTAAAKDAPVTGNASNSEVVLGNDTRLSDSRNAADVYSWAKASSKPSYTASEVGAIPATDKGANNGVAELDSAGKVLSSQLPSYVDDVLEYASTSYFPVTGESGKIYISTDTNKTYRWSGTGYAEISESLALGETSSTAYRGDRGKTAYDHSQLTSGNPHNVSKSDVGLGNVPNVTTDNQTPTVTEASSRTNLATGDTLKTIIGKIKKYFTDLKTVAFTGSYNDLSDKPTIPTDTNNRRAFYGTCSTAAATAAKEVTLSDTSGWELKAGTIVGVRFTYTNTAVNVTLNVNGSGAKSIYYNNSVYTSNNADYTGYANRTFFYMYDGTYWVWINESVLYYDTKPSAYIDSAGGTQNKGAQCTNYSLLANSYIQVINIYANTYAGAITLNINGKGAKPIYINGTASSSSNYTLPAGTYIVYYDGTNYYFRTDGKLTGAGIVDIGGNTAKFLRGDGTWQTPTDTNNRRSFFGTCSTAADTAAKVVTLSDTAGWELRAGTIVGIKFTNTNTSSNVTLNVNNTGAKSIYFRNSVYTDNNPYVTGTADKVTYYMYDGTNWAYIVMGDVDDVNRVAQYDTSYNTAYPVLMSDYSGTGSVITGARKSSKLTFNPGASELKIDSNYVPSSSTIKEIRFVTSLPSDASSHPEILYLVGGS